MSDVKVRRAIVSAIDRSAINRAVFDGNCAPATQIFDKDHWAHDPGFVDFHYDPDGARVAIKVAGAVGKSIEIVAGASTQYEQVALVVQSELKDIGLNASIAPMPFGDAVAAFRTKTRDAFVFNIQAEPHPDVTYDTYFLSGYAVTPEADVPALTALSCESTGPADQLRRAGQHLPQGDRHGGRRGDGDPDLLQHQSLRQHQQRPIRGYHPPPRWRTS